MSIFVIITLALILVKILCMMFNRLPSDVLGLMIIAVLLVTATLSRDEALSCFSSNSVVLVGVLSVLAAGLIHSGVPHWIAKHMLRTPGSYTQALGRLFLPAATLSMFVSNLAVVSLFISVVKVWAKKVNVAPSQLLLPLSYASTLGGLCTLIGNSPNLVVADFYTHETGKALGLFAPFWPGMICAVVGLVTIILLQRLIPVRKAPEESFESSADYTLELLVPTDCPSIGETVEEASLYSVNGGQLIEIVRFDREVISPVPRDEFILGGDRLVYSGQINSILELRETHGLVNATHHVFSVNDVNRNRKLQMAIVDAGSPLVGHAMLDLNFEDKNNVVLVAVSRAGERLTGIPREIELRAGDTILLEGSKLSPENFSGNLNFLDSVALPQSGVQTLISSFIMLGMVLLSLFDVMPLLESCFLATLAMGITRCFSVEQLQNSINWKMLMIFAGSVCLGKAIDATHIASFLGQMVQGVCGTDALWALIIICFTATFVTEFISNTTAAAVFTPVALHVASDLGANPLTFVIGLMMAVSCSFATPIGSETNTLIYGYGGFRFLDFLRLGLCMNLILLAVNILVVTTLFPL